MIIAFIDFLKNRKIKKLNKNKDENKSSENKKNSKKKIKQSNKRVKKHKKKKKEKIFKEKSESHKISDIILSSIFTIILLLLIFNLALFFYGKPYIIDGRFYRISEDTYKFIPNLSKCNITENSELLDLSIGDNIYISYNEGNWRYLKNKSFFNFKTIKGTIYDKNDYYIYINFELDDILNEQIFLKKGFFLDRDFSVVFKKYFGKYKIHISKNDLI